MRREPPETLFDACCLFGWCCTYILVGTGALMLSVWLMFNGFRLMSVLVGFDQPSN